MPLCIPLFTETCLWSFATLQQTWNLGFPEPTTRSPHFWVSFATCQIWKRPVVLWQKLFSPPCISFSRICFFSLLFVLLLTFPLPTAPGSLKSGLQTSVITALLPDFYDKAHLTRESPIHYSWLLHSCLRGTCWITLKRLPHFLHTSQTQKWSRFSF